MSTTDTILPAPQLRRAWQLAGAYGHEWAAALMAHEREIGAVSRYDSETYPVPVRDYTAEQIATITRAQRAELSMAGIDAPTLCADGDAPPYIEHLTATGRLRWLVYADGSVTLDINRPPPEGCVLRATVAADGTIAFPIAGRYFQRHVEALETALVALRGEDAALACLDLYAKAVDGHLTPEAAAALERALFHARYTQEHRVYSYLDVYNALVEAARALVQQPGVTWSDDAGAAYVPRDGDDE